LTVLLLGGNGDIHPILVHSCGEKSVVSGQRSLSLRTNNGLVLIPGQNEDKRLLLIFQSTPTNYQHTGNDTVRWSLSYRYYRFIVKSTLT
jgi:hypothetical protein